MVLQCFAVCVHENLLSFGFVVELHDNCSPFFFSGTELVDVWGVEGKLSDFLVKARGDMETWKRCFWNRDVGRDSASNLRLGYLHDAGERSIVGELLECAQDRFSFFLGDLS